MKHARNRPFGANDMSTMGDAIRDRQLTSEQRKVIALTITTELSLVEIKISGCRDAVRARGSTAIAQY